MMYAWTIVKLFDKRWSFSILRLPDVALLISGHVKFPSPHLINTDSMNFKYMHSPFQPIPLVTNSPTLPNLKTE